MRICIWVYIYIYMCACACACSSKGVCSGVKLCPRDIFPPPLTHTERLRLSINQLNCSKIYAWLIEQRCRPSSLWIAMVQPRHNLQKEFTFCLTEKSNTNSHFGLFPSASFIVKLLRIGKILATKIFSFKLVLLATHFLHEILLHQIYLLHQTSKY